MVSQRARIARAWAITVVSLLGVGTTVFLAPSALAAAGLTLSSTTLNFSPTPVGDLSPVLSLTITNNTGSNVTAQIGGGALNSGHDFVYDGENCPSTLNPGDTCAASYQFSPESVASHLSDTASLMVQGTVVTITLVGVGSPDFTVTPTTLAFPDTVVGFTAAMQSVVITNVSSHSHAPNLAGGALFHHTDFASDGQTCGTLAPGASCAFRYHFAPTGPGTLTDGTDITVDGIAHPITVTGKAITGIDISPTTMQFPDTPVGQLSSTMDVTITNVSANVLHPGIGGGSLAGGQNFVYDGENCPDTLAPGQACRASYQFAPKSAGQKTDTATLMISGGTVPISLVGGHSSATSSNHPASAQPTSPHPTPTHPIQTNSTEQRTTAATSPTASTAADSSATDSATTVASGQSTSTQDEASAGAGGIAVNSSVTGDSTARPQPLTARANSGSSFWPYVWIAVGIIAVLAIGFGGYAFGRRRR